MAKDVIIGRYQLLSVLGRGGMGSVWEARHVDLSTPAAVKLIDPIVAESTDALTRFRREAKAAARIRSNHVVQILDYGVDHETPYIAMELLVGESLAARLRSRGVLSPRETGSILLQVAKALTIAHELGIVHRDLKPDNIFIAKEGDEEVVKVLDFGIAKSRTDLTTDDALRTQTGAVLGTPFYMSPEQVVGEKTVDHRTDVWAMAVIACECLTGQRPFVAETFGALVLRLTMAPPPVPSRLAPVPAGFDAWFATCTARNLDQRYPSIKAAALEFEALLDQPLNTTRSTGAASRARAEPTPIVRERSIESRSSLSPHAHWSDVEAQKRSMYPILAALLGVGILGVSAFALRHGALSAISSTIGARPANSGISTALPTSSHPIEPVPSVAVTPVTSQPTFQKEALASPVESPPNAPPRRVERAAPKPDVPTTAASDIPVDPVIAAQTSQRNKRIESGTSATTPIDSPKPNPSADNRHQLEQMLGF